VSLRFVRVAFISALFLAGSSTRSIAQVAAIPEEIPVSAQDTGQPAASVVIQPAATGLFEVEPIRLQGQQAPPPPQPDHTGFGALIRDTGSDFVSFPRRRSTWVILGIGAGAAALVHPWDDEINNELQEANTLKTVMKPGKYLGYAWVQGGAALGMYFIGRYAMEPEQGTHTNRVAHLGFDLLRANIVSQALTYGIKVAVRRDRPTGECCAFPSGHASLTFASAAVLERHFGYRASWPMFVIAGYVAASRLTDNRHFASDVLFGSALGMATGWTVVGRHGRETFSVYPVPVKGGIALAGTWTPSAKRRAAH
jgi:membrane-associated phospholipid phosphatase